MNHPIAEPLWPELAWLTIALAIASCPLPALAMGGHFDADDALMLEPGRCQVEVWATAAPAAHLHAQHLGPACRVGPLELGLAVDRLVDSTGHGGTSSRVAGVQLKWVTGSLMPQLSIGLAASIARDSTPGTATARSLYAALTWFASDVWQWHANVGRDRDGQGEQFNRAALAAEWAASDRLTLIAEILRLGGAQNRRIGLRISLAEFTSIDMSAMHTSSDGKRRWGLGLNHEFGR